MNYSLKSVRPKIAQRALLLGLAAGVQVAYADDFSPNEYAKAIDQVNYQGASQETLARPSFNEALTPMANRFLGQTPSAAQIDELTAEMSAALRKTGLVVARVLVTDADKQAARETGVLRFTRHLTPRRNCRHDGSGQWPMATGLAAQTVVMTAPCRSSTKS